MSKKLKSILIVPEGTGYRARLLCDLAGDDFLLTVCEATPHGAVDSAMAKYNNLEVCANA